MRINILIFVILFFNTSKKDEKKTVNEILSEETMKCYDNA